LKKAAGKTSDASSQLVLHLRAESFHSLQKSAERCDGCKCTQLPSLLSLSRKSSRSSPPRPNLEKLAIVIRLTERRFQRTHEGPRLLDQGGEVRPPRPARTHIYTTRKTHTTHTHNTQNESHKMTLAGGFLNVSLRCTTPSSRAMEAADGGREELGRRYTIEGKKGRA
jgi:hypothetical protein